MRVSAAPKPKAPASPRPRTLGPKRASRPALVPILASAPPMPDVCAGTCTKASTCGKRIEALALRASWQAAYAPRSSRPNLLQPPQDARAQAPVRHIDIAYDAACAQAVRVQAPAPRQPVAMPPLGKLDF